MSIPPRSRRSRVASSAQKPEVLRLKWKDRQEVALQALLAYLQANIDKAEARKNGFSQPLRVQVSANEQSIVRELAPHQLRYLMDTLDQEGRDSQRFHVDGIPLVLGDVLHIQFVPYRVSRSA